MNSLLKRVVTFDYFMVLYKWCLVGGALLGLSCSWLLLLVVLMCATYAYYTRNNNYWQERGVPYVKPVPVLGNLYPLLRIQVSPGQFIADIYNRTPGAPFVGYFIFDRPALVIRDPALIKNILVKDFDFFPSRHTRSHHSYDPVGAKNLFTARGNTWRYFRMNLSSTFTSRKMRNYLELMIDSGVELVEYLKEYSADTNKSIRVRSIMARHAVDVISLCMFGIKSNALQDGNSEFRVYGRKVFNFTKYRAVEMLGIFFVPGLAKLGHFHFFPEETTAFFSKVFEDVMSYRRSHDIQRNDLLDALMTLKDKSMKALAGGHADLRGELLTPIVTDEEDIVAQCALFFTAGFETSSVLLSFTLYELAANLTIQDRLRSEIIRVFEKYGKKITYSGITEMKYLDMVLSETLRKYPPLPYLDRICAKDYQITGTDVVIEKGTPIFIPTFGIHRDSQYYPNPQRFDPERFNDKAKKTRTNYIYVPFGQGPRSCIGMRFGLLSAKVILAQMLIELRVDLCEDTPTPVQLSPFSLLLAPTGGVPLTFRSVSTCERREMT